ncbi:MAG: thioredoxin [Clostridiales bacterium]|nr:thioredoxin [Clostridiales bacterium]
MNGLRVGLLCAAAAMMVYGISRGEMAIVLKKAVNLCLECIGLG